MAGYAATYSSRSFDFGRAFSHTFSAIWRNAPVLLTLILCVWVVSVVLQLGLGAAIGFQNFGAGHASTPAAVLSTLVSLLVLVVQIAFLSAIVSHLVGAERTGLPQTFGEKFKACLAVGARKSLPLIGLYVVQAIPIWIASLFFLIPGIILATVWCVTVPVVVNEEVGVFASFARSAELTRDNRWILFGFSLVTTILLTVAFYLVFGIGFMLIAGFGMASSFTSHPATTVAAVAPLMIIGGLLAVAAMMLFFCFALSIPASAYHELRRIKEGGQDVAKLFT